MCERRDTHVSEGTLEAQHFKEPITHTRLCVCVRERERRVDLACAATVHATELQQSCNSSEFLAMASHSRFVASCRMCVCVCVCVCARARAR